MGKVVSALYRPEFFLDGTGSVLARAAKFNHYLEQDLSKDSLKCNAELGRDDKEFSLWQHCLSPSRAMTDGAGG